jgi:hypothetical protein
MKRGTNGWCLERRVEKREARTPVNRETSVWMLPCSPINLQNSTTSLYILISLERCVERESSDKTAESREKLVRMQRLQRGIRRSEEQN